MNNPLFSSLVVVIHVIFLWLVCQISWKYCHTSIKKLLKNSLLTYYDMWELIKVKSETFHGRQKIAQKDSLWKKIYFSPQTNQTFKGRKDTPTDGEIFYLERGAFDSYLVSWLIQSIVKYYPKLSSSVMQKMIIIE